MFVSIMRFLITITAGVGGVSVGLLFNEMWTTGPIKLKWALLIAIGLISALLGYFIAPVITKLLLRITKWLENILAKTPTQDIMGSAVGLILGLIIANLLGISLNRLPFVGPYLAITATVVMSILGWGLGSKKKEEIATFFSSFKLIPRDKTVKNDKGAKEAFKVVDTSVIIDGRIADICKTGFIEGVLIIPSFVLEELRHIADSADVLKRNRGRRGLDILNKIRKELEIKVEILEKDYEDILEVDSKLVRLAQEINGKILTNDFNLNKVAELQGVTVLNINELANAVKPVVLPGEEMYIQVIKDGKENGQGIAYLDDGTMIVVENGRNYINKDIHIIVTSVLQTAAGRMIFAKPKGIDNKGTDKKTKGNQIMEVDAGA